MKYLQKRVEFSLSVLIELLKINYKFLLVFFISFEIVVLIASFIIPKTFSSQASLLPPKKESSGGGLSSLLQNIPGAGSFSMGGMGKSDDAQLFGEIITSKSVADYLITSLELKNRPQFKDLKKVELYDKVNSLFSVDITKFGVVYINASVKTPAFPNKIDNDNTAILASNLVNYAIKGLDKIVRERSTSNARKSKLYIGDEIERYKFKLDSIDNNLEQFQTENKVLEIEDQTKAVLEEAIEVNKNLAIAEIDLNLARLEFQDKSPKVISYEKTVDILKSQYHKIQSGGLNSNEAFSIPLGKVPELIKKYTNLIREKKVIEQVKLYLETQYHQEAIQEQKDIPIVEVLDKGIVPDVHDSPRKSFMLLLGAVLSTVISTLLILFASLRNGTVYLKDFEKNQQ